ncbi:hypothetical protein ACOMHN_027365 [Nucella lapillus]
MSTSEKISFIPSTSAKISGSMSTNSSADVWVPEGCILKKGSQFVPWDNEDNLIPKQVDVIINVVLTGVFLPLLFLVSFSANIVNMVVFYKQGLKERINVCLFTLSLLDLLYVVTAYGYSSDVLYMYVTGNGEGIGPATAFFARNYLIGFFGFLAASQVVSSVIAMERCLCIIRPLLVKTFLSTKKTVVLLCSSTMIILGIFMFSSGMRYDVLCVFDPKNNRTLYQLHYSEIYIQNKEITHFFSGIVFGFSLPTICTLTVTVCTVVTVVKMKKLSRWRETVSSVSDSITSRDLAITRMIVGTSILFIVCIIPAIALRFSVILVPEVKVGGRFENFYFVILRFYILGSVINCTCNFFVYYFCGTKFRETVRELFMECGCRQKNIT